MRAPKQIVCAALRRTPLRGAASMGLGGGFGGSASWLAATLVRGGESSPSRGALGRLFLGEEHAVAFKLGLVVLLTLFNALCWGTPMRYKRFTGSASKLSVASTFSGGVFLALAFGHMVPEAAAAFGEGGAKPACLWTLGGYLLIWAVERWSQSGPASAAPAEFAHAPPPPDGEADGAVVGGGAAHGGSSAAMLLGALSVHSMLETMALAVARTKSAAVLLSASIALHQPAESLALLVALLRSGIRGKRLLRLLLTFTAMGPVGAGLGLGLQKCMAGSLGGALDGALIALTAGTFVYVGATEVIPEEFEDGGASKSKIAALLLGVVSILGLANLAEILESSAAL